MGRSTEFAEYMLMAMKDAAYNVDITRIADQYSKTFNTITGEEANAAQQVQNLITRMGQAAESGEDITVAAESAGATLKRMFEAG